MTSSALPFLAWDGFAPGRDVSAIQIKSSGSTDSVMRFIRFRSSPETIARIATRFKPAPFEEWAGKLRQVDERKPDWWLPKRSPGATCYVAEPFDDSFASTEAWLTYDPATRDAHFHYVGID